MSLYENLTGLFERQGCKLLTKANDIDTSKGYAKAKVSFIAKCGHPNEVTVTNFRSKSSGVLCKDCTRKLVSEKLMKKQQKHQTASWSTIQECEVIKTVEVLLKDTMNFQKTTEGCLSDIIVKPLDVAEDMWLRVQVKTTIDVCHNLYSFKVHANDYENHVILCHCINHNKYWLIPYDVASKVKSQINIGLTTKSNPEELSQRLLAHYKKTVLYPKDVCMIPENKYQQTELMYKQKREHFFHFITFQEPEYAQSFYDFKVNDIPVQEKIAYKIKNKTNAFLASLYRSKAKKGFQAYELGMNTFYWIHIPEQDVFYVIPEDILHQKGYIQGDNKIIHKKPQLFLKLNNNDAWYQTYKYRYDCIVEDDFKNMFKRM